MKTLIMLPSGSEQFPLNSLKDLVAKQGIQIQPDLVPRHGVGFLDSAFSSTPLSL